MKHIRYLFLLVIPLFVWNCTSECNENCKTAYDSCQGTATMLASNARSCGYTYDYYWGSYYSCKTNSDMLKLSTILFLNCSNTLSSCKKKCSSGSAL